MIGEQAHFRMSQFGGSSFYKTQGAGGNAAVKVGDTMIVKASGYRLIDVRPDEGFAEVDYKQLVEAIPVLATIDDRERREVTANYLVTNSTLGSKRASIETLLHVHLEDYSLHTHDVHVLLTAPETLDELSKRLSYTLIALPYAPPGYELGKLVKEHIPEGKDVYGFVLKNHGLVLSAGSEERLLAAYREVLQALDADPEANICLQQPSAVEDDHYLIEDSELLLELATQAYAGALIPDAQVYLGWKQADAETLDEYLAEYKESPKLLKEAGRYMVKAASLKKANEAQEVLKLQLLLQAKAYWLKPLAVQERIFLSTWEAEKYRQQQ